MKIKKNDVIRARVTEDFKKTIKNYAERQNITMSELIEKALKALIEKK